MLKNKNARFATKFKVGEVAQITMRLKKVGLNADDLVSCKLFRNKMSSARFSERLLLARLLPHVSPSPYPLQSAQHRTHTIETLY